MARLFATKFIQLLKTFDEAEIKALESWLRSPWCNSNKNLIRLFDRLKRYYPDFTDRKLTKEKLFRQVLPDGKFSDRRMNNLLSEGYLSAERFLIFQRLAGEPEQMDRLLRKEFQSRELNDWFFKAVQKEVIRLQQKDRKEWEDHLQLLQLFRDNYHHPNPDMRMQPGNTLIIGMEQQLDLVYALEKAAIINEKISRSRVLKEVHKDMEEDITKWAMVTEGLDHPAIELYRMRFEYTDKNRYDQYQLLRTRVLQDLTLLSEKEQKIHLLSLVNDSMQLIKTGQLDIVDMLPIYQLGLEAGVLLDQEKLARSTYTTVVIMSNTKGDFTYTRHFIERYTDKLEETTREDCRHWANAHTAYRQQQLEDSLDILNDYTFQTFYFQLFGRVLNAQVYFDLYLRDDSYLFFLLGFLDTFEKWVNREKVWSLENKVSFLRFIQKCRALTKAHAAIDFEPQKLASLLEKEPNIQALNWLKQKREEVLRMRSH